MMGSPKCVSMSRSVMRRTILPEITSGGTKNANHERPTWREVYEIKEEKIGKYIVRTRSCEGR